MSQCAKTTLAMTALSISTAAIADVWLTHDTGVVALPPPPANAIFTLPDVQDLFFSPAFIRTAGGPNLGNILVLDNPALLGLQAGDNIDAFHHELRPIADDYEFFPGFVFSLDVGAVGQPGTGHRSRRAIPDERGRPVRVQRFCV